MKVYIQNNSTNAWIVCHDQITPIHIRSGIEMVVPAFINSVERHRPPRIRFDFELGKIDTEEFEFVSGFEAISRSM